MLEEVQHPGSFFPFRVAVLEADMVLVSVISMDACTGYAQGASLGLEYPFWGGCLSKMIVLMESLKGGDPEV